MIPVAKRTIVCLCGSTKFHEQYVQENMNETMKGNIVLSVGVFGHTVHSFLELDEFDKEELDQLHKDKILMADEILVLDVEGYIGQSTQDEIEFAKNHGKIIRFTNSAKIFVPCPKCKIQNRLDLTTDGSDGEFGWQEYDGWCGECFTEFSVTFSDRQGGAEISIIDDDEEEEGILLSDDERITESYEQKRRNRRYEEADTDE